MPLTNDQLHEIRDIIRDHHYAFIINTIGIDAVATDIVDKLKAKGLVNIQVNSIQDAYLYGQVMAMADDPMLGKMSYEQFREHVRKNPIPLGDNERRAVQFAQQEAAQFIVGLGNTVDKDTGQLVIEADAQLRAETRGIVQDATAANIAKRESVKKLKSDLGWAKKDWSRDWDRIAITEKHVAMQRGVADGIAEAAGPEARVAKRPSPDCCDHCARLYLGPDDQPRIFKLSTLEANGINNYGRKAKDWLPVLGAMHPFCMCQLLRIPAGWGFDEEGSLVPGGELGIAYESPAEFQKSYNAERALQKAFALQGHVNFQGMDIAIENKVGTLRHWTDGEGNSGATKMLYAYGYVVGTNGADEDEIDVFVGPDPKASMAYIIHQQDPRTGIYDEDKSMLGFSSATQAQQAYEQHYDRPDFFVALSPMPMDQFKRWCGVTSGDRPFRQGKHTDTFVVLEKAGPYMGPRGGQYKDPALTIPWKESGQTKRPKGVEALQKYLVQKYGVQLWLSDRRESMSLEKIIVTERGAGTGSKVMQELVDYADEHGKIITASPSSDFGGSKGRVVKFNKRFGFVDNKGRNKDYRFSDTMLRLPKGSLGKSEPLTWRINMSSLSFVDRERVTEAILKAAEAMCPPQYVVTSALSKSGDPNELIIKIEKAQTLRELGSTGNIPAFVAAAGSPEGNRNPGQGTVINQLVGARHIVPPTVEDMKPSPREHVEAQAHQRDRGQGQSTNRESLEFRSPLEKPAERFYLPDTEPYGVAIDEDEVKANRELAEKELADKQGASNDVEIKKGGTPIGGITPGGNMKIMGPNGKIQYVPVVEEASKGPKMPDHIVKGTFQRLGGLKAAHADEMEKPPVYKGYMQAGHNVTVQKSGKDAVPGVLSGVNYQGRPVVEYKGKQRTLNWADVSLVEGQENTATFERLVTPKAMLHASTRQKQLVKEVLQLEVGKGKPAKEYMDWLRKRGGEVLLVGGIVRDLLSGTVPGSTASDGAIKESMKDIDIVTTAHPSTGLQLASAQGHNPENKKIVKDWTTWGTVQILDGVGLDYVSIMSPSLGEPNKAGHGVFDHDLEDDSNRRDFTANCLSYDVYNDVIIDPTGEGVADAQAKVLRLAPKFANVAEAVEANSSLPLRFWKFRARGWKAEVETLKLMRAMVPKIPPATILDGAKKTLSKGKTLTARNKIWDQMQQAMVADGCKDLYDKHFKPWKKQALEG